MTVFSDDEILQHFEFGYDRDYCGVALHCLLCPTDSDFPMFSDNGVEVLGQTTIGDSTLGHVVTTARLHYQERHA